VGRLSAAISVTVSPERLMSMNITVNEVFEALEKNNSIAGGAYIERMNETYFIVEKVLSGRLMNCFQLL
jgi:cobalt-zinc-cadmium resistance protein CzcA